MFGDNRYLLSARVLGQHMSKVQSNAWLYYIDFVPPSQTGAPGTAHGSDAFILFAGGMSKEPVVASLANRMLGYWSNFARHGDPNGKGLANWPRYTASQDQWLIMGDTDTPRANVLKKKLDLLEQRYRRRFTAN